MFTTLKQINKKLEAFQKLDKTLRILNQQLGKKIPKTTKKPNRESTALYWSNMFKIDEEKEEYVALRKLNEKYLESKLLKAPEDIVTVNVIIELENNEKENFEEIKEKIEELKYKHVETTEDKYINEILTLKRKHNKLFKNIII